MKNNLKTILSVALVAFVAISCQKMDKPELGNYPVDANPPNGPLKFYVAFDGTTTNPLMNAVDSIRANFPSENPFTTVDGIKGKGVTGVNQKFIKYPSFNSWASSSSFTISIWYKKDGQTKNNNGTNGPEYLLSMRAVNNFHWSNAVGFVFLEGNNTACAVKTMFVSNTGDAWFTWEGGQSIAGLCDNNWHHLVLTYDETTSQVKLYIDGVQNPNVKTWGGHGALNLATSKISEFRIGAGPSTSYASDDWLACTFKGSLDQLRMYSTVLTQAEIQALFTAKQ
ncbi:MAG TPA: LamG domain-containing protein [Chitinophagaceae bacterium]|nr:LamG domain-containing protein [Chitinophagaceae bacterium]HRF19496.1 LamG domain-containing protein [Chitinophagaceae bacterium]